MHTVCVIRRRCGIEGESFLWIKDIFTQDGILPLLAAGMYFINFGRFITPENEHTIISRLKRVAQFFMILWYPWLCHWPSGTVFYVFCNGVLSWLQVTLMRKPYFVRFTNPKLMISMYILYQSQLDDKTFKQTMKEVFAQSSEPESINEKILRARSDLYIKS